MARGERPGFFERVASHVGDRLAAIPGEVAQTVTEKVIPQGATEIAQALYGGGQSNVFTPYGHAQQPLTVEGPQQQSYTEMLRDAARRGGREQERDVGLDR